MLLLDYIKNIPLSDLAHRMMAECGVVVKNEGSLYLFKYDQLAGNFQLPVTHECRGVILRRVGDSWEVVSRPFDKFFNLDQGYSPIFKPADFDKSLSDLCLVEKADGSCIQVWNDSDRGTWRASTLGAITSPKGTGGLGELFWEVSQLRSKHLVPGRTYLFELCTHRNAVVTSYSVDHVVFLGCRDLRTGEYFPRAEVFKAFSGAEIRFPEIFADVPPRARFTQKFADDLAEKLLPGKTPEGFVVCSRETGRPLAKVKTTPYLAKHHAGGSASIESVVESFFAGVLDDLFGELDGPVLAFAEKFAEAAPLQIRVFERLIESLEGSGLDRKSFATRVKSDIPALLQPFCFTNMGKIHAGAQDLPELLDEYLKTCYAKHIGFWKAIVRG